MTVTVYSQRDPRWADLPLGTDGGRTIGEAGCLITAVASVVSDLKIPTMTPAAFDMWLCDNHGYQDGNEFIWRSPERLGMTLVSLTLCKYTPAPVYAINQALLHGFAVVAEVDAEPGGDVEEHWVRVLKVNADGKDALIMDPWQMPGNEITPLSKHYEAPGWDVARALMAVAIYSTTGA
jgi:hypothetical protein